MKVMNNTVYTLAFTTERSAPEKFTGWKGLLPPLPVFAICNYAMQLLIV